MAVAGAAGPASTVPEEAAAQGPAARDKKRIKEKENLKSDLMVAGAAERRKLYLIFYPICLPLLYHLGETGISKVVIFPAKQMLFLEL